MIYGMGTLFANMFKENWQYTMNKKVYYIY